MRPVASVAYAGNLLILAAPWMPRVQRWWRATEGDTATAIPSVGSLTAGDWVTLAVAAALAAALVAEMRRYEKPGGITANLAAAAFTLIYVGLLLSYVVALRLQWGIGALASLILVVKAGDTGAYTVGRLIGRHPMAPRLSPKKTIEGAAGALASSVLASWAVFAWIIPRVPPSGTGYTATPTPWWSWISFGLLIGGIGMVGDLAESLLKRDRGRKDSSRWMPGFGGVLDLLDSILLAAPLAYACWCSGWSADASDPTLQSGTNLGISG